MWVGASFPAPFNASSSPPTRNIVLLGQSSRGLGFKQVVTSKLGFEILCWKTEKGTPVTLISSSFSLVKLLLKNQNLKSADMKIKGLFSGILSKKNLKFIVCGGTSSHCCIYQLE